MERVNRVFMKFFIFIFKTETTGLNYSQGTQFNLEKK
jgi:hypothetical protein